MLNVKCMLIIQMDLRVHVYVVWKIMLFIKLCHFINYMQVCNLEVNAMLVDVAFIYSIYILVSVMRFPCPSKFRLARNFHDLYGLEFHTDYIYCSVLK